jgi:hypothetical protein
VFKSRTLKCVSSVTTGSDNSSITQATVSGVDYSYFPMEDEVVGANPTLLGMLGR